MGKDSPGIDRGLIEAHRVGIPPTSGVALGLDRLLMLATKAEHIRDVIAFG